MLCVNCNDAVATNLATLWPMEKITCIAYFPQRLQLQALQIKETNIKEMFSSFQSLRRVKIVECGCCTSRNEKGTGY